MVTKANIGDKVKNRISGIPSAVTDAMIQEWVEDCHVIIENKTGTSFVTSAIPANYTALITDMGVSYLLEYMIKKRISIGEINLSYQELLVQKKMLDDKIERQFLDILRGSTSGAVTTTEPIVNT